MRIIPRTSVGVEIAGQDLRIAVLRDFAGKRRVLRADVLQSFIGLSEQDRAESLVAHFKRNKLSNFNVQLALPGTWGVTRDLEFPATGIGDKLRSAVALQVENLSPWPLDEIYWDCVWETPAKSVRPIVVHVAIVPRGVLDPWVTLFRSAGLALTGASLSSLSWAHGATALWGSSQPLLVIGAENEYVEGTLVHDERVNSMAVTGGDTAALVHSAEMHLVRSGRLDSINAVRLVIHGAASAAAGAKPDRLPLEGSPDAAMNFGSIAAALLGLVRSSFRSNLIPDQLRRRRNHLQLVPTYVLILALVVLGLLFLIREPYQQLAYAGRLDREIQRLAPEFRSGGDQEARLNRLSDQLKALDVVINKRDANLEALLELARILPAGTWLTSYQYQDYTVTISGVSDSAATIQKLVEDSALFRDAQFTSSITRDSYGKDRFVIRATIEAQQ
jgi:Tfp pilus assembly protein PilN